jgi:membrane-associated protein
VIAPHLLLFGVNWMDPGWLFTHYESQFVWLCLAIIFVECGLFFPILPGDTLLFSVGIFIAAPASAKTHLGLNIFVAMLVFSIAALLGNVVGYEIGRRIGPPLRERDGRILKKKYFDETHEFFEKHGSQALVIGRFVPFVRTYVTVVAGIARMERHKFAVWSTVGAVAWVVILTLLGYLLGSSFPSLASQIDKVILVLLVISVLPVVWEWYRRRRAAKNAAN